MSTRYPPIAPKNLTGERKEVHDACYKMASEMFGDKFVWKTSDDAMVGPFSPLLYVPLPVAQHFLGIAAAVGKIPDFPAKSRETAILATGSHFKALYEIYAHERVAEKTTELSRAQINKIKSGEKPDDLDEKSSAAFDVAIALARGGGPLDDALYEKARQQFGQVGAQALIQYVGVYAYTCIVLNGSGIPIPDGEKII